MRRSFDIIRAAAVRGIPGGFYRNMGWQTGLTVVTMVVGFLVSVVVGRALGPGEFGLMALGLGYAAVVFQLTQLRLHEAIIRYVSEFRERGDATSAVAAVKLSLLADLASCLLAVSVAVALSPLVSRFMIHDSRAAGITLTAVLSVFGANVFSATAVGLLRVLDSFRLHALISIAGSLLRLTAVAIAVMLFDAGILAVLTILVAVNTITNGTVVAMALKKLHGVFPVPLATASLTALQPRMGEIARFVRTTYFMSISSIPTKDLDINILGLFAGAASVGEYKIAKNFMQALWGIADPAFLAVYPEIARLRARCQLPELTAMLRRLTAVFGVAGIVVLVGAVVTVPQAIVLMMGPQYAEAGGIFRWMAWGFVFWAPFFWINPLVLADGRPDISLKAGIATAAILLVMYFAITPAFGPSGTAFTYACATPVSVALALALAIRARVTGLVPLLDDLAEVTEA